MEKDSLGYRMKSYEFVYKDSLIKKIPVIVRVDGRAFHTLTRNFDKPFDLNFINTMVSSSLYLASNMQGFKLAYIQSDEASFLLTDCETDKTQGWFDYNRQKIISISASLMTAAFNSLYKFEENFPVFDSRAFNIPKEDVLNYFLWRAKDWKRNSLQMYSRAYFSHKELQNKKQEDMHEMLHSIGKNWSDLPQILKNGTFLYKSEDGKISIRNDVLPKYEALSETFENLIG